MTNVTGFYTDNNLMIEEILSYNLQLNYTETYISLPKFEILNQLLVLQFLVCDNFIVTTVVALMPVIYFIFAF